MHFPDLHPSHVPMQSLSARLHSATFLAGAVMRYLVLTAVACILYSAPISFREVSHVHSDSAPRP